MPSACLQRAPSPQQTLASHCLSAADIALCTVQQRKPVGVLSDSDSKSNDDRASPPGIPIRNQRHLERESSTTSQDSQHWHHAPALPAPQQDHDPATTTAATTARAATTTSEGTGKTSRSRMSGTAEGRFDTWLDSTATAMQQIHEGDDAGIDGAEQQHDPMYESPDRVDYETDFGGRHGVACPATCCEGHARTTTEDSGDNTGDSSPGSSSTGSSTLRPGRSISSVKTDCGPREEEGEGEGEEESQRAYQAGAGQPSESANAPGPAASVRMAYRPGEETTNSACLAAAGRRPSTSSSSDSSDSASSVKTTDSSEEVVPESTSHWGM